MDKAKETAIRDKVENMFHLSLYETPDRIFPLLLQHVRDEVNFNKSKDTRCIVETCLYVFKYCVDLDMKKMYRDERTNYYYQKCPNNSYFDGFREALRCNCKYTHEDLIDYFDTFMEHYDELYKNDSALRVIQVAFEYASWKPSKH